MTTPRKGAFKATISQPSKTPARSASPIAHAFVLMLENRSFDNLFLNSRIPGRLPSTFNLMNVYHGKLGGIQDPTLGSQATSLPNMPTDPGHEFPDVLEQLGGTTATYAKGGKYPTINNSGFVDNYAKTKPPQEWLGLIMGGFATAEQVPVIYHLATQFALCDQWFSSLPGPTWPNRYFVHGASSAGLDHSPSTAEMFEWETFDGFKYPHGSIYDAMNNSGVSWRLYYDSNGPLEGKIPQVASIHNISFVSNLHSLDDFASDLKKNYPYQYTFIEPNYGDVTGSYKGGSSQHPMDGVAGGESLIKAVYEAIRNSPIWNSSVLIITYDEHGGFYDSLAPGKAIAPDDNSSAKYNKYGFTFNQLGVRVPAVIVSPYVTPGFVDHTIYDHTSILATVERVFGMSPLTARDASANDLLHILHSPSPRADCPTTLNSPAAVPASAELALTREQQAAADRQPLPEGGNLPGFLAIMLKTEIELSSGRETEKAAILENFKQLRKRGDARAYIKRIMSKAEAARAKRK